MDFRTKGINAFLAEKNNGELCKINSSEREWRESHFLTVDWKDFQAGKRQNISENLYDND